LLGDKAGILGANMGAGIGSGAATIGQVAGQTAAQGAAQAGAGNIFTPISETALGASANMVPTSQTLAAQFAGNAAGTVAAPTIGAGISPFATNASTIVGNTLANAPAVAPGATGFFGKFAEASRAGLPGMLSKYAPYAAGIGLATPFMSAPKYEDASGAINNSYQGPYRYEDRPAQFASSTDELLNSSAERDYFGVDQPGVYNMQSQLVQPGSQTPIGTPIVQSFLNPNAKKNEPMYSFREVPYGMQQQQQPTQEEFKRLVALGLIPGMAKGGELPLDDGAFIVDARTVSEMGNGSSNAGIERLAKLGGAPIRGPGDGVSDSIPARIGGDQKARVARDEVKFSRDAVERLGGGSHKKGVSKLYKLMDKAHKARKKAGRGSDTKLAAGLSAL
jgi:hypothetical protein